MKGCRSELLEVTHITNCSVCLLTTQPDFDPEDDTPVDGEESSEDEESSKLAGREHYEAVDQSQLRKPQQPQIGKKYGGVAISRSALEHQGDEDPFAPAEEEEDNDPFARSTGIDGGSEISGADTGSDEDIDQYGEATDVPKQMNRLATRKTDRMEPESDGSDSSESESVADSHVDMDEMTNDDENDSDASTAFSVSSSPNSSGPVTGRKELHELLRQDTARVAAGLSSQHDVKQGKAVKVQKATYDRFLDARIKLQKGLAASNDFSCEVVTDTDVKEAIAKAEAAALSLWSTIDSLRCTMLSSKQSSESTKKRKRPLKPTQSTPLTDIWEHSQSLESVSLPHRRHTLNHWSNRTRASAPSQPRSRFSANAEPALTDVLEVYLSRETQKLTTLDTTSAPHSEAPTADRPPPPSPLPFSDDAFYQSLLRDLIASRTNNDLTTSTSTPLSSSSAVGKPPPINTQRNRRNVDTKASKGRKIRYTVHEKLVSFMAAEDRSTWSDGARRELFGSLFGGRSGMDDGGEVVGDVDMDMNEDAGMGSIGVSGAGKREEGALRLFRS